MSSVDRPTRPGRSLGECLDPRRNGLNSVRLVLAGSVIVWHSFPLTGTTFPWPILAPLAGTVAVDGFFTISGFLLAASWLHRPALLPFLRNRALRVFPAFWVCLLVVAFVVAPLSTLAVGGDVAALFTGPHSAWRYVLDHLLLRMQYYDVAGTPADVPYPSVWNGSLWVLWWEALAYLGLAAIGVAGLLRRRSTCLVLLGLLWGANLALALSILPSGYYQDRGSRLGLMFVLGVVLYLYRDRVPVGRAWIALAVLVVPVSLLLPDHRILAAPAIAFLVLVAGARLSAPLFQLAGRDVSYGLYIYGFPVQQTIIVLGAAPWSPWLLSAVSLGCTLPVAAASWFLVERPALRLKSGRRHGARPQDARPLDRP